MGAHDYIPTIPGEAAAVIAGPNDEISATEISRALVHMRARWQHAYGLVEVG